MERTRRWLMYGTVLVFLMQAGFALLEAGSISSKNVKNVLIKNLLDACAGGVVWWAVGYSFAYGDSEYNEFIGSRNYFMYSLVQSNADGYYAGWMFQWVRTRIPLSTSRNLNVKVHLTTSAVCTHTHTHQAYIPVIESVLSELTPIFGHPIPYLPLPTAPRPTRSFVCSFSLHFSM